MSLKVKAIFVCFVMLYAACSPKKDGHAVSMAENAMQSTSPELSSEGYMEFVKDNSHDLAQSKEIGDFVYTVRFLPAEYLVLRELGNDTINKQEFDKKTKEMNELQYFNFMIQNKAFNQELLRFQLTGENEYYSRIEYFSFKMQDDIKLVDGKDTLSCELFHFERTYDIAPYLTFNVAFKNTNNKTGGKTFSFDDMIFKNGKINITFDKTIFTNIPKIKTI
jgi:hypothetical protein